MGDEVVSSYLRSKFSSTLEEAEADPSHLPIISRFRSINERMSWNSVSMTHLYDLMDALSECRIFAHERHKEAASKKGFYLFRVFFFEKNMRSRLDDIERKLKNTAPQDNINGTGPSAGLVIQQTNPNVPDPSVIMGFESQIAEIENLLGPTNLFADGAIQEEDEKANQFKAIGIVGRCGCGKTALAQKVFASRIIENNFFPRIWVCLSDVLFDNECSDLRVRILDYILRKIGQDASELDYADYSVIKLLEKLRLGLTGKRYLIVLDDAWRMDEWFADLPRRVQPRGESFTHGLPKGSGGAVIVTGRAESVVRGMVGEGYVIRPHLTNEICWRIFSDAVRQLGKIDREDPKLINMKDKVITNCDGLPLAAKTLANLISNLLSEKRSPNSTHL